MPVVQLIIERPGLERSLTLQQFSDPVDFILAEHDFIENVIDRLEGLAENLHTPDRRERADGILDYFRTDFPIFAEDQEALAELLEDRRVLDCATQRAIEETRDEHAVLRQLIGPVLDGLEEISATGLPLVPQRFVVSALILCEFLRLHVRYVEQMLLRPARDHLSRADIADLGRDMAFRRGMGAC